MFSTIRHALASRFSPHCLHCGSIEFRNVGAQNAVERTFIWLLQPCRCDFCGRHFFLFRWQS